MECIFIVIVQTQTALNAENGEQFNSKEFNEFNVDDHFILEIFLASWKGFYTIHN